MASFPRCPSLPFILLLLLLVGLPCFAQLALAGRSAPANPDKKGAANPDKKGAASSDKKETECFGHEGTVLIPGIGRYMIGSHERPGISGLDHSVPAAVNGQYLPGNDDTFVPNPGFEVPNPFRPAVIP